jgi:hypothetical protein
MSRRYSNFLAIFTAVLTGAGCMTATGAGPVTLEEHIRPLLKEYCIDCHNPQKKKGDVDLEPLAKNANLGEHRDLWEKIAELTESGEMPPEKKPQPTDEQRETLLKFIDGQLAKVDCNLEKNPGRVTIRRLNREEYKNTVRDLLGVNYDAEDFPNDEVGYGFDNIGDVLSLSPMLMEKFVAAAEAIVQKAIAVDAEVKPFIKRIKGDKFTSKDDAIGADERRVLAMQREGEATTSFDAPAKGEYLFRVRAFAELAGPEPPKLSFRVGGRELQIFNVTNQDKGAMYEVRASVEAGTQKVAVAYLNNYNDQSNPDPKLRGDRNVYVDFVEVVGPTGLSKPLPESHKRLIARMPQPGQEREVAEEILRPFATRAYRRPVSDDEVARLVGFVELALKNKGTFLEGVQTAVQAALCSPHFLFRWELDPDALKPGEIRELTDYEVASRLSYFLWSSMPDAPLFELAAKGELRKDGNLTKQTARMIQDWRARAFVSNFGGQWLQIRNIWEVGIDPETFPKWDDSLKGAMKEETEQFLEAIIKEDRPVTDLLDADFTFLNEKLARWYGIEGVQGDKFQRVKLPADSPRGGVLTQGSVLVSTSTPTRTAPVIRGKWILEQILGTPPPPAPPDVPPLEEQKAVNQSASLRQRLELHRSQADCAGCHAKMDPLGFALENFDATGAWRDRDGKFPIDATGKLANGTAFNGPRDLKKVLKGHKNFVRNLTQQMMTYALGRGLEFYDKCACDAVIADAAKNGNRMSALIAGIVTSDPFLKRKREVTSR